MAIEESEDILGLDGQITDEDRPASGLDELVLGGRLSTADLVPPELRKYARMVQDGDDVELADLQTLMRNGMVRRANGLWVLTQSGVRAAAMDRGWMLPGGILTEVGKRELALGDAARVVAGDEGSDGEDGEGMKMLSDEDLLLAEKGLALAGS